MMWIQSGDWNFGAWTVGSRRGTYPTLEQSVVEWSHNGDTPRSEGKRYRDTRPWEIQAETWGQEEREIDTNQPTICFFAVFAVTWRSEDNDVIINRTRSDQSAIFKSARGISFSLASVIGLRGLFPANFSIVSMCKDDISWLPSFDEGRKINQEFFSQQVTWSRHL